MDQAFGKEVWEDCHTTGNRAVKHENTHSGSSIQGLEVILPYSTTLETKQLLNIKYNISGNKQSSYKVASVIEVE